MGFVMFGKEYFTLVAYLFPYHLGHMEFTPEPRGHRLQPGTKTFRGHRHVTEQQALECQKRLVVVNDMAQPGWTDLGRIKAVSNRMDRKSRIVFLPRKSLFLGRGKYLSVPQETCGAIMVKT